MKKSKMDNRVNKPRVFLSHSSLDKGFIEKLNADLRKCKIEPWLDTEEIRDGKPWLKVIFEDGIATCDAVIAYFTENSLKSKMFAKEVDATLVEQLSERGVDFLPYVSVATLRQELRSDIRTLQCRDWNDENYSEVLPSVVAEIWRSYMERMLNAATLQERAKRLEKELELKKLQEKYQSSVFPPSEERDFQYIHQKLARQIELTFSLAQPKAEGESKPEKVREVYRVNLLDVLIQYVDEGYPNLRRYSLGFRLLRKLNDENVVATPNVKREYDWDSTIKENISLELQTYGLVRFVEGDWHNPPENTFAFTDKAYRFRYWLGYNALLVGSPTLEFVRQVNE